jgi:hypothetical protein
MLEADKIMIRMLARQAVEDILARRAQHAANDTPATGPQDAVPASSELKIERSAA